MTTRSGARKAVREALASHDGVRLHNLLMRVPQREIAHALALLDKRERERILSILGPAKRARVREEMAYQERLFVREDRSLRIVRSFVSRFAPGNKNGGLKSYVRPR